MNFFCVGSCGRFEVGKVLTVFVLFSSVMTYLSAYLSDDVPAPFSGFFASFLILAQLHFKDSPFCDYRKKQKRQFSFCLFVQQLH